MTAARQHMLPDPVPQSLGPNALGNPIPWHRTVISSFCQRPTDGNIIVGARTASSPRESLIWKVALEARWGIENRAILRDVRFVGSPG